MKLWCIVFIASCAVFCSGQDVHTEPVKDGVNLSISAQQSYEIIAGEKKRPTLSIQCSQNQKGTKVVHLVMFSAGGSLAEDNPETTPKNGEIGLKTQMGSGTEQMTNWIPYGDVVTYAFYGKTEPERAKFLQLLLASPTFTVEFTPFLTGTPVKAIFDLSRLRDEVNHHPECVTKPTAP